MDIQFLNQLYKERDVSRAISSGEPLVQDCRAAEDSPTVPLPEVTVPHPVSVPAVVSTPGVLDVTLPRKVVVLDASVELGVTTVSTDLEDVVVVKVELDPDCDEVDDPDSVIVVLEMTMMLNVEVEISEFEEEEDDDVDTPPDVRDTLPDDLVEN